MRRFLIKNLSIEPGFCVAAAIILLTLPVSWSVSWFLSVAFHELCHVFALIIFKKEIYSIKISFSGVNIKTEYLEPIVEFLSAAAGPMGGLSLLLLIRIFPQLSVCALIHSMFNLLPIYPMDGGRMIHSLCAVIFDRQFADQLCKIIEGAALAIMFIVAILLFIMYKSLLLPVIFLFIFLRRNRINLLAKNEDR